MVLIISFIIVICGLCSALQSVSSFCCQKYRCQISRLNTNDGTALYSLLKNTDLYKRDTENRQDQIQLRSKVLGTMRGTKNRIRRDQTKILNNFEQNTKRILIKLDKKFDAIDKRFEAIDKKFDAIDKKFDTIDNKFEAMEKSISQKFEKASSDMDESITEKLEKNKAEIIHMITDLKMSFDMTQYIVISLLVFIIISLPETKELLSSIATLSIKLLPK